MTIHKFQGMNVENTVIDLDPTGKIADLTFAALSRLKGTVMQII